MDSSRQGESCRDGTTELHVSNVSLMMYTIAGELFIA